MEQINETLDGALRDRLCAQLDAKPKDITDLGYRFSAELGREPFVGLLEYIRAHIEDEIRWGGYCEANRP